MKTCNNCKQNKELEQFYKRTNRPSYRETCKECCIRQRKLDHKKNPPTKEQNRTAAKIFRDNNPNYYREWRLKNLEKERARSKLEARKWRKKYPGLNCEKKMREHAAKLQAMPKWLTDEQKQQIRDFYKNRPAGFHVDHIVPLRGKEVRGLHVPWNLQYLPALENLRKNNRLVGY